jgi:uncharacterized protein (TIGR02246 family)
MRTLALVTMFCVALSGPAIGRDKSEAQKAADKYAETVNKGDAAAIAAFYTDDAYLLPPGAEMVQGRSNIEAFWKKAVEQDDTDFKITILDVKPLGSDAAREIGTFTFKPKGEQQEVTGKYVVVLQRAGNDWKIATDIFNMNK